MGLFNGLFFRSRPNSEPTPVGGAGPRGYVGGLWEEIGTLQFRFLVDQGLRPKHVLLDVACGSLRGGVRFIPFLDPGNYLGIDINESLVTHGINNELGQALFDLKRPSFVISGRFEFDKFERHPDFALAQSLFTHLTESDILLCLTNLRAHGKLGCRFFATFFETNSPRENPALSHPHAAFEYTRAQMETLGERGGWNMRYIGNWDHPRGQVMVEYNSISRT